MQQDAIVPIQSFIPAQGIAKMIDVIIIFEKTDYNNNTWKFELNSYTMKDYLYYKYYLEEKKKYETSDEEEANDF